MTHIAANHVFNLTIRSGRAMIKTSDPGFDDIAKTKGGWPLDNGWWAFKVVDAKDIQVLIDLCGNEAVRDAKVARQQEIAKQMDKRERELDCLQSEMRAISSF